MYRLSRAELLELARPFPIALRRIRWEALRLAIMRTIVATHREQLKAQAKASAPNSAPPPSKPPSSPVQMPDGTPAAAAPEAGDISGSKFPPTPRQGETMVAGGDVWQEMFARATSTPTKGASRTPGRDEPVSDPSATLEKPSLIELGNGLAQVRGEVAEMKKEMAQATGEILRRLSGLGK